MPAGRQEEIDYDSLGCQVQNNFKYNLPKTEEMPELLPVIVESNVPKTLTESIE